MTRRATSATGPPQRRWPAVVLAIAATLSAYAAVALIGVAQDARGERVLAVLDPVFTWIRDQGTALIRLLLDNGSSVGWTITAAVTAIAVGGLVVGRRRALPLLLLAAGVSLASWGQILLLADRTTLGLWLYLSGIACTLLLGIWCPMPRLRGFPVFPRLRKAPRRRRPQVTGGDPPAPVQPDSHNAFWTPPWAWECTLVFLLALTALISRSYALNELSHFLDLEVIDWWTQSRTGHGLIGYLNYGFMQNNGGTAQMGPQWLVFNVFGTSIFTLRMASVLWGIAAVPLMYWLVRRIGGVGPAVVSTLLLIAAPDQLFWSRSENTHFPPITVLALITAHIGLWMVRRLSIVSVLAAALWMPACRFFYSTCMVMFLYPLLLAGHAFLSVRGAWRRIWYVVPLLAGGLALWIFSLSFVYAGLHDWNWRFVNPASVYGGAAWTKHGRFSNADWIDLVYLQSVSMTSSLVTAVREITYHADGFSHWYVRSQPSKHRTTTNSGLVVLVALGLGYLFGQPYERRTIALLAWLGLSLLPGIMSDHPASRRMAMMFPAMHVIAGVTLAALVRIVREQAGVLLAWLTGAAASVVLACILLTSLASHFQLPIRPMLFGDYVRFAQPLLEKSDAIFHNLPRAFGTLMVFGNLDRFLESPPGFQFVEPKSWLRTALHPECDFTHPAFQLTMPPERLQRLREEYDPQRISFVLLEEPATRAQVALVRDLYPAAEVIEYTSPINRKRFVAISVDITEVEALRQPSLWTGNAAPAAIDVLKGVTLAPDLSTPPEGGRAEGIVVQGGLFLERDGWYEARLDPQCFDAALRIDGGPTRERGTTPMLAGVHPFTIMLPSTNACPLPLHIVLRSAEDEQARQVPAQYLVSRDVASLRRARAIPVIPYDGYTDSRILLRLPGRPVDFGVDAHGDMRMIVAEHGRWYVQQLDGQGAQLGRWDLELPHAHGANSIAVAADGTSAVLSQQIVSLYNPAGIRIGSWMHPWLVFESELALWKSQIVVNIPHRDSIAVFTRSGTLVREFRTFDGGPGKLYHPLALTVSPRGDVLVLQRDGQALVFHVEGEDFAPRFVSSFAVDSTLHGAAFAGRDRILVPDRSVLRVYDQDGNRMMAATPARDLANQPFRGMTRVQAVDNRLYVLAPDRQELWTVVR